MDYFEQLLLFTLFGTMHFEKCLFYEMANFKNLKILKFFSRIIFTVRLTPSDAAELTATTNERLQGRSNKLLRFIVIHTFIDIS